MELKIIRIFLNNFFGLDESEIILKEYWNLQPKKKILKDWIPLNKLDWDNLSLNDNAIDLLELEENYDKINWHHISLNPNAIDLLKKKL